MKPIVFLNLTALAILITFTGERYNYIWKNKEEFFKQEVSINDNKSIKKLTLLENIPTVILGYWR